MSASTHFDILIVGAGLSGASLACALRGSRYRIGLLERQRPEWPADWDARIYAISPANVEFLQRCGAWAHLDAQRIAPVERMVVAGDAGGQLVFSAYECGLQALAWIVESSAMARELWETARRQPNIELICPAQPESLVFDDDVARLRLADGREISAGLVVGADGVNSWVRDQAAIPAELRPYGELGVVANFTCAEPHFGTAFQWFRRDGVLAYLPLPGNRISIVWSTPEAHAQELLALSPEAFASRVAQAGEGRLGRLELLAPPAGFPLRLMKLDAIVAPRLALIGDAAHAVHPLSGHGINLGFQDARELADQLLALPAFRDCGELAVLRRYQRARAEETLLVREMTDGLQRLFKPAFAPLALLRNAGMNLAGAIPPLRSALARYAAGLL
ncbi:UbiH/UbiF family hydroxylase [Uliginosibacterium sp. 31-12]|uniref:UbiH/UbiF family hydroxylase n=1 Tax=Uliginosibacterium sp. 31-12 TaxID=3062781 RepID=UPI0026E31F8C|nr:UbiH/UbiF family hydroxylase [Uliginosibacterium sp. 31-12]MDO6387352.1 UbiH/UbiF family hydroxylase [Uliginosibacterium sp. 31-12]